MIKYLPAISYDEKINIVAVSRRHSFYNFITFITSITLSLFAANAANVDATQMLSVDQYNRMEPYLNNKMRNKLRPADAKYNMSSNQAAARSATPASGAALSAFANPNAGQTGKQRRVVARARTAVKQTAARSAAPQASLAKARAAATGAVNPTGARRVVQRSRSGTPATTAVPAANTTNPSQNYKKAAGERTASQCLSDYTACMDTYCHRPSTRYDRCYCSAKLAQVDSQYKPDIDALVKQLAVLQNGGNLDDALSQDEVNQIWDEIFGATGGNSMADLDTALDIDWSTAESSIRGQNAFVQGDGYCKQNLAECYYMSDNMKNMYRTTIGKDCKTYETYLKKMKYAAEQAVAAAK